MPCGLTNLLLNGVGHEAHYVLEWDMMLTFHWIIEWLIPSIYVAIIEWLFPHGFNSFFFLHLYVMNDKMKGKSSGSNGEGRFQFALLTKHELIQVEFFNVF